MFKKLLAILAMLFYAAMAFAAVDANTGSAADLDGVKGIGPAIASHIVDARKNGPFKDWNDLIARVRGIGPKSAIKLSEDGLTVNGTTYAGGAPVKSSAREPAKTVAQQPAKAAAAQPAPAQAAQPAPAVAQEPAQAPKAKKEKKSKKAKAASAADAQPAPVAAAQEPAKAPKAKKEKKTKKAKAAAAADAAATPASK